MKNIKYSSSMVMLFLLAAVFALTPADLRGETVFEGKTVTLILGEFPGSRRDRIARATATFLEKYIPGKPKILIQNIPGGKGIPAQQKFNKSKPDGSVFGLVTSSDLEAPVFGTPGATYKPENYLWAGAVGTGKQRNILFTLKQSGFNSIEDLKSRQLALGSQGVGARSYLYGRLIGEILGIDLRWVLGYSTPELYIAIERGEVDGRVNDAATIMRNRPDWFDKGILVPHVAMTLPEDLPPLPHPALAKVPSIMDFAKTELHRDIIQKLNTTDRLGGAIALPPGSPESIRIIVERAMLEMGKDPKFQKHWENEVGIRPFQGVFSGAEVAKSVKIYSTWQPDILKAYKRLGHEAPRQK